MTYMDNYNRELAIDNITQYRKNQLRVWCGVVLEFVVSQ
jgi:hypothetical protein